MSIESSLSKTKDQKLEDQFNKPETVEVEGHLVKFLDIKPDNPKIETPVVLAPGFGTYSEAHIKTNILEMARLGRRTMFIDEPHGIPNKIDDKTQEKVEEYFLRQIAALIGVLDAKGIEKVDVVGNSEGGIYTSIAADLYPERFNSLVLCNTGGMIGEDSPLKLMYRFIIGGIHSSIDMARRKQSMSEDAKQQMREGVAGFKKYLKENPRISWSEIKSIANANIRNIFKRAKSKGIGISIIHTVNDDVFPMKRVQKEASRTSFEKELNEDLIVDGFYSILGTHGEFSINPEQYTRIADQALTALQKKKDSRKIS